VTTRRRRAVSHPDTKEGDLACASRTTTDLFSRMSSAVCLYFPTVARQNVRLLYHRSTAQALKSSPGSTSSETNRLVVSNFTLTLLAAWGKAYEALALSTTWSLWTRLLSCRHGHIHLHLPVGLAVPHPPSTPAMIEATPWTQSPQAILEHFDVDPIRGLTPDQASKHARLYGKNGASYIRRTSRAPIENDVLRSY
jgi:hypothetical protein